MKYPKPKIILIDLDSDCETKLLKAGYKVEVGSFGQPYKVTKKDVYDFVYADSELPNLREQEIIFIDLKNKKLLEQAPENKITKDSDIDIRVRQLLGFVDPRPMTMFLNQKVFSDIWSNGGLFIVFAEPFIYQEIFTAEKNEWNRWELGKKLEINIWSFLPFFNKDNISINSSEGNEFVNPDQTNKWTPVISKYLKNAKYSVNINASYIFRDALLPILLNKYREIVSGLIVTNERSLLAILPQIENKSELILDLLCNLLPEIHPKFFPYHDGQNWRNFSEYEMESVKQFKKEKDTLLDEKEKLILSINEKIEAEKNRNNFLYNILSETGNDLVDAIENILKFISFKDIKNIDKELSKSNPEIPKQEDLQILDNSPMLLIEVKGIFGLPREADIFQIVKYTTRRMKELKRTDVQGLVVVNHQKSLPPLSRDKNPFTPQQVKDAEHNDFGLITTWDIFLLVKGMLKYNWKKEVIKNKFYKAGRINRIPEHYSFVGEVENYWEHFNVVGIRIESATIKVGDRLGYILENDYLEEDIDSLQVEKVERTEVNKGELAGVKTVFTKEELKKKIHVYKIINEEVK